MLEGIKNALMGSGRAKITSIITSFNRYRDLLAQAIQECKDEIAVNDEALAEHQADNTELNDAINQASTLQGNIETFLEKRN